MFGASAVTASDGWFKQAQSSLTQTQAASGSVNASQGGALEGIVQSISQAVSSSASPASRAATGTASLGAVSGQVQNALLSLQSVGTQGGAGTSPVSASAPASVGGLHRHHHHGKASASDGQTDGSSLPAAISATADDITTLPNPVQQSVNKALQSYLTVSSGAASSG